MIFGILFVCAGYLENVLSAAKGFSCVSMYSYAAYLCHHFIFIRGIPVLSQTLTGRFHTLEWYVICLVITGVSSFVLYQGLEFLKKFCVKVRQ